MTPAELKAARRTLGLTAKQMAALMDMTVEGVYRVESATGRKPPVRYVKLLQAYLAGYRPDDWPQTKEPTE